jgi:hypothetical protein
MVHFLFYAGQAYNSKAKGDKCPVASAVKKGTYQEYLLDAKHSAMSYEDLPSDYYGADFGANYFDPKSTKSLGQQMEEYFRLKLGATDKTAAPNWSKVPKTEDPKAPSTFINKTINPMFTTP